MPGKRILSDAQLEEMAGLRERGWSLQRIANHFTAAGTRISASTLNWQCLRVGADLPAEKQNATLDPYRPIAIRRGFPVRPFRPEEDEQLLQLERSGPNYSQIADRLGRKSNSIRGRLMTLARRDARMEADF